MSRIPWIPFPMIPQSSSFSLPSRFLNICQCYPEYRFLLQSRSPYQDFGESRFPCCTSRIPLTFLGSREFASRSGSLNERIKIKTVTVVTIILVILKVHHRKETFRFLCGNEDCYLFIYFFFAVKCSIMLFFLSLFSPRQATSVLMSRICPICCMNLTMNHNYGCFMTQTNGCWEAEMHFLTG